MSGSQALAAKAALRGVRNTPCDARNSRRHRAAVVVQPALLEEVVVAAGVAGHHAVVDVQRRLREAEQQATQLREQLARLDEKHDQGEGGA